MLEMKKVVLLLVMLFLSSARAVGEDLDDQHELSYWADWSDGGEQNQEKLPFPFEHFLQRIARRPRPQQFYGLMGKRDAGYSPVSHKRYKTDSFVGLMGKRSLNSVMEARSIYENQQNGRSSTCLSNYQYTNITFPRPTSSRYINMNSQNSQASIAILRTLGAKSTHLEIIQVEEDSAKSTVITADLLNGVPCKCLKEDANETVFPLSIEMFK